MTDQGDGFEYSANDIAIVGMAARLPGARTIDAYWQNLRNGVESIRTYTDEELLANGESPENLRKKNYVRAGGPLEGMELFDGDFFGFSPKDSAIMDPQHRQLLEAAWEALENAGHPPEKFEGPVGIWTGCGPPYYLYFNLCTNPDLVRDVGLFLLRHTGNDKDFLPTRVSYLLNLQGPSMAVQTACSSSLTAVHLACQSLLSQEVDMALAGGVTVEFPHRRGYLYHEGEVLSPDGHCHAFDHRAKGTVFGSGTGVVVLRRIEDALDDRDHIWALIKGTAVNNDGSTKVNFLAPSVDGQARCMVEAHGISGVDPDTIDYIECHGTGTYLGDPIEIAALTQAFRKSTNRVGYCRIGSVKTNIGHLDNAAGVASLIKASLAIHNREMPPSLNFDKPNPTIDFETSPFVVNDRLRDWQASADHPRRAAINSLGVGGTNAHAIIEEAPPREASDAPPRELQLFVLSGKSNGALDDYAKKLAAHLEAHSEQPLADIAWTLHVGRRDFDRRRVFAARSHAEAAKILREADPRRIFGDTVAAKPSVVFMFPGGGAQYPHMGKGLYESEPVFREHLERGLRLLDSKYGIRLRHWLLEDCDLETAKVELEKIEHQLSAIYIVEYALAQLWIHYGLEPKALCGHSLGEYAAACLSGVMSYEDALGLVVTRSRLLARLEGVGGMATIGLPREEVELLIPADVDVSVVNVPDITVVSGPIASLEALEAKLAHRDDVEVQRLPIPVPAHSRMLDPILGEFRAHCRTIRFGKATIPLVSNRSGSWLGELEASDPEYWVQHLRGTVNFSKCLETLTETPDRVLIEVGPGRTLSSLAKQHSVAGKRGSHPVGSLRHRDDTISDDAFFVSQLGRVWAAGASFDWDKIWGDAKRNRVPLPTYAFQHQHFFIQPGKVEMLEEDLRELPRFDDLEQWGFHPTWKASLPEASEVTKPITWLVFMDAVGVGKRLRERLMAKGHSVISVYEGDSYVQRSDDEYAIAPERGREGYSALVAELMKQGRAPQRIAHLWMLTGDESFRPGSSFFHRNQERGFYSLLFLSQAIADEGLTPPIHLTIVANGMSEVGDEPVPYPEKSTLLGPAKVIPREMPGITCAAIDVNLPETNRQLFGGRLLMGLADPFAGKKSAQRDLELLVDQLESELLAPAKNANLALRGEHRYLESWEPIKLPPIAAPPIREHAVVMITGGLGGLGLLFAEHLAQTRKANLVLVGRSELPAESEWDAWLRTKGPLDKTSQRIEQVRALQKAGAEVLVCTADVTIENEMVEVVERARQRFGRIDGVLHTAGVVNDGLIQQKSMGDCEDVFTPKIHGTLVLDRVLAHEKLEFFVLFSSTSSAIAPAGQVDYVAANAFLNAFAQSRRQRGAPVTAICWGIWNDVGMAHESFHKRDHGEARVLGEASSALFDARIKDSRGRTALLTRYQCASHWILDEHRTASGHALIPGTGYIELAREALDEFGEKGAFTIEDLFFIRPLAVGDDETKEVRVRLDPNPTGYSFEVRSRIELDGKVGWEQHIQANLALGNLPAAQKVDLAAIEARCDRRREADPNGLRTPQEQFLDFGPRWRVLREAKWGKGEAIAVLSLAPEYHAELARFGLHPALLDIATGYAMDLIPGYEAKSLYVPISYEAIRVRRALTPTIHSWVRWAGGEDPKSEIATFDITLTDEAGDVLVEIERFSIKKASGEFAAGSDRPAPSEVEFEKSQERGEASPAEQQLMLNHERGILASEGVQAFDRVMAISRGADPRIAVSSMDLNQLIRQADKAASEQRSESGGGKFARPNLDTEYVEARDDIERMLVGLFQDLLGVEMVGVKDSFFDLGGHSLIAVRLFAKIKKQYAVDFPISVLFEAPTIERVAELVRERVGGRGGEPGALVAKGPTPIHEKKRTRYTHLVAMHPGTEGPKTPFFIVAGMFGNVLNLRHLAHLIGTDRRFYGLQALGLYGDSKPHETFEEMASAYLAEMKTVQPHGPYMIGGFSGGGITAFEMAHQLRAQGEDVSLLVLLDSVLPMRPPLTRQDRIHLRMLDLQRKGPAFIAEWAQNRVNWEMSKLRKRFEEPERDQRADEFRSEEIGNAFLSALPKYQMRFFEGKAILFRPPPQTVWAVGGGRLIDKHRHYITPDNGWTPWVSELDILEVPGDHDSMVLEPNVRVLARKLRKALEAAERGENHFSPVAVAAEE